MRLLACLVAVDAYIWQEQTEYSFPRPQFAIFIFGIGVWSASLCLFLRGPSRIQPPQTIAGALDSSAGHFGNLRNPACRLRTPCKVGARISHPDPRLAFLALLGGGFIFRQPSIVCFSSDCETRGLPDCLWLSVPAEEYRSPSLGPADRLAGVAGGWPEAKRRRGSRDKALPGKIARTYTDASRRTGRHIILRTDPNPIHSGNETQPAPLR